MTTAEMLAALNTRPATRVALDADGREIMRQEFPNRASAHAAPWPEGTESVSISVYMLDLVAGR